MLEPNASQIISTQSQGIGFDSDVSDSIGQKSSGNSLFAAELTRAQASIDDRKTTQDIQNGSAADSSQSEALTNGDSRSLSNVDAKSSAEAVSDNSANRNPSAGAEEKSDSDGLVNLKSVSESLVSGEHRAGVIEPDSAGLEKSFTVADVSRYVNGEQSDNSNVRTSGINDVSNTHVGTFKPAAAETLSGIQREGVLNASSGVQYDDELAGSNNANTTSTVDVVYQATATDNPKESLTLPVQQTRMESQVSRASSNESVLNGTATTNQAAGIASTVGVTGLSNTAAESGATVASALRSPANSSLNATTQAKDSLASRAIASQGDLSDLVSPGSGRTNNGQNGGVSASSALTGLNPILQQSNSTTASQGVLSNAASTNGFNVNSSVSTNTVGANTVSVQQLQRSTASVQPGAQPLNQNNTELSLGARSVENANVLNSVSIPLGTTASALGVANNPIQSTPADIAIPISKTYTGTGNADGSDSIAISTLSVGRGVSADSFSGTHSDAGGSQHNLNQGAAKLEMQVDKGVAVSVAANAENLKQAANVTPGVQAKKLAAVNQQPDLPGISTMNASAEGPSSNVYHVTTNGIITANSTPLNAAPLGDLTSAPRTVLLGQPGADQALAENLRWAVNEKLSRVTVNVSPANLGPISVSVDVENQSMNVSIITNNSIAKEAIDSLLPRMREHFSNEGYQQVSVDVSSQQERNSNLRNQLADMSENHGNAESDTQNANSQNSSSSQYATNLEPSSFSSGHQPRSNSLIDTYA